MDLEWVEVPGGVCQFGDKQRPVAVPTLVWTRTLIAYGHLDDAPPGSVLASR